MVDCLISLVQKIGDCICIHYAWPSFIKPHVDYWWCFDSNIQGLRDRIEELKGRKDRIEQEREEAGRRNASLLPWVEPWLKASTERLEEAQKILLPDDNIPKDWNLISRYLLGKNAKKTAEEIAKLLGNEINFDIIAYPVLTLEFESRKSIEKRIIDSLKKNSVDMIGICGMGGIGKTTMAKRIEKRAKEEDLFDKVVMVAVGQKVDTPKIRSEIAERLKVEFDEKDISTRTAKLSTRPKVIKRKLIILDDVWDPSLKFEELGIPVESSFGRCKVLLTSRSRDTCNTIKHKEVFYLNILEEEEAWSLFKEKAGICDEDSKSELQHVAKEVAKECKGLPMALVTVGLALQGVTNIFKWRHSLSQLRRSNPIDFPEVLRDVYKPLKLSYDYLENDRVKNLFLMCCLFPEDYDIPIDQLTWYSMGLRLFDDITNIEEFGDLTNIEEARNRTHTLVENLKSRSLLIAGEYNHHVKMHDVVRDVAIYVGSIEKRGFLKSLNSKENSSDVNCNWMSVDISNEQMEVPVLSRFPKLRLLMLSSSNEFDDISNISFEGMEALNVLSWESISVPSLPPMLGSLENLHTLRLLRCQVENISVIGELTSLKILSCCKCKNITELPAEIRRLKGLRLLEFNGCRNLKRIPFGVISSLSLLEELKINKSFSEWETGGERGNASLTELESLHNLTCLEIEISDCTLSAQEICLSQKLVRYRIWIDASLYDNFKVDYYYYFKYRDYEKAMHLKLASVVGNWIQPLARNAEALHLRGDGSDNINLAEMENLRILGFSECSTVKNLRNLSQNVSLCNLNSIYIRKCSNLKHLFSVAIGTRLEILSVEECESMEQVFWNEIKDNNTDGCIEFPKLKKVRLWKLPNLTAFCQGLENIKFPNLIEMFIGGLPKLNSLSPVNSKTVARLDQNTCFHFVCNPLQSKGSFTT